MNKLLILTSILALQSCATYQQYTVEFPITGDYADKYACEDAYNSSQNDLILFMAANPSKNTGAVYVSGKEFKAKYSVEGIAREWLYGNNKYLIKLNPDGKAYYFDMGTAGLFDSSVTSSAIFECRSTN